MSLNIFNIFLCSPIIPEGCMIHAGVLFIYLQCLIIFSNDECQAISMLGLFILAKTSFGLTDHPNIFSSRVDKCELLLDSVPLIWCNTG